MNLPILYAAATLVLGEVLVLCLRRFVPRLGRGLVLHGAVGLAALTIGLGRSEWFRDDSRLMAALTTSTLVVGVLALYAVLDASVLQRPGKDRLTPRVPALLRELGRVLAVLAVGLFALSVVHGIPLSAVLVSSTVVSAVIGLSLQDVLKNVFAGISMQLEAAPRVGDWLTLDGLPAKVVEMSWRTTRLRTNEGHMIVEPNARIADSRLTQLGNGTVPVAFGFEVGLPYDAPPAQAKTALMAAAASAPGVLGKPVPQAMIREYGDSAILYELRVWTRQVDHITVFRDAVFSRIWYEVHRAGLSVPFPIRTVHMQDEATGRTESAQREQQRIVDLLGGLVLFEGLAGDAVASLARCTRRLYFDAGERLVEEGEPGDSLFIIDRGSVVVTKASDSAASANLELAVLSAGSFFGEMSLLTGEPRSATVQAEGGCEVLLLCKEDLAPMLEGDPTMAEVLCRAVAERNQATEDAVARRRARLDERGVAHDTGSILRRVRHFFRLPGG